MPFWNPGDEITADKLNNTVGGYDAVVAASGGDYTSIKSAVDDGKKRIFVKNGTYNEDKISITNDGTIIVGERRGGVIINSQEDGGDTSARAIEISAHNVFLNNLRVVGYESGGTLYTYYLIYFASVTGGYKGFMALNCDLVRPKGAMAYGNYGAGVFVNCLFDALDKTYSVESMFQDWLGDSAMFGCRILSQVTNTSAMSIFSSYRGIVEGCIIIGDTMLMDFSSYGGGLVDCVISGRKTQFGAGHYINNYFDNNELDPGTGTDDYMVKFAGGPCFVNNNNFYCNYYSRKIVTIGGLQSVFNNNRVELGTKLRLESGANYCQFCNNIWKGSATSQQMDIEINSNYCQVNENIVVDTGYTPTVTDNGTGNNKLNNILLQV